MSLLTSLDRRSVETLYVIGVLGELVDYGLLVLDAYAFTEEGRKTYVELKELDYVIDKNKIKSVIARIVTGVMDDIDIQSEGEQLIEAVENISAMVTEYLYNRPAFYQKLILVRKQMYRGKDATK